MLCRGESLQMFDCADCYRRGGRRKGLICQDNGSGPKNSVGPASNKQDQAFNGLSRARQLQNVFVQFTKYICIDDKIYFFLFQNTIYQIS